MRRNDDDGSVLFARIQTRTLRTSLINAQKASSAETYENVMDFLLDDFFKYQVLDDIIVDDYVDKRIDEDHYQVRIK